MSASLLVLAAGMASRYGSLKQIDQFGPSGEGIFDYSVYDAIEAGFTKIGVFHSFIASKFIQQKSDSTFHTCYRGPCHVTEF